jgi:hypothetical protein
MPEIDVHGTYYGGRYYGGPVVVEDNNRGSFAAGAAVGGAVIYNCANVYYQPFYQGSTLVYQVVQYP